jgi:S1-C subfamily serine protease
MPTDNVLTSLSNAMADAVARARAALVTVDARRRFPASGVAYREDLILTADHVVEREEDIRVVLEDGSDRKASLIGRDPGSDLALLRLPKAELFVAERSAGPARVGQLTLALGRPGSDGVQASLGVVSAVGGPVRVGRGGLLDRYYRTDAIPYPGFSGGPLIDTDGGVLGINTSGLTRGASITLPAELAWDIAATLTEHGRVRRGYLGIRSQSVSIPAAQRQALGRDQATGLLLVGVEEDSPAAEGGMLVGDILVALGGEVVEDIDRLQGKLLGEVVGESTPIEVLRGGEPTTLTVTIGERGR